MPTGSPPLARKLGTTDYFTFAFGTMVGVGWLIVMDDWLRRGGPLGAILGFTLGGAALLPIGFVYGHLVMAIPDAASEIAYTERAFSAHLSFITGWIMALAYWVVCPWEAVAVGKIAAYLLPELNSLELYRMSGVPVYLPHLVIGLSLVAVITTLNYRGIRISASFQNWTTFGLLVLFIIFASLGMARGASLNFRPPFSHGGVVSVLLVIQIVPYFMTGFESVPKCAEEANPDFRARGFFRAIMLAILVGVAFYVSVIAIVAYLHPWQALLGEKFLTAAVFKQAFRSGWIVDVILAAALLSLLKVFNGNFVAASRLFFALGRRGLINHHLGRIHPKNLTPTHAVLLVGFLTVAGTLAGEAILIPITEVGSMASACGWLAACAAYLRLERSPRRRALAVAGLLVALGLILMKLVPLFPGHFSLNECAALAVWLLAGLALKRRKTESVR